MPDTATTSSPQPAQARQLALKRRFATAIDLRPYMDGEPSFAEAAAFMRREQGGAFTWKEIARYRDAWKGPLLLKGVLHPADAERAVRGFSLGEHL